MVFGLIGVQVWHCGRSPYQPLANWTCPKLVHFFSKIEAPELLHSIAWQVDMSETDALISPHWQARPSETRSMRSCH